ncbi:immunoglobulin-like domain-containing protein [Clostridium tarantellae]|uniref:DUF5011 domain-containing protein n=1 Tax=Clostridium tarantellae TaxID=39493 RepID=A0A6I1MM94_9CLOT|nr:immunoglobulin-like domain-containing protein [Clostridium tarantellae]MPQ44134.1 DUF5011 domain-containing protein [Clostridium tarantellae]
MNRVMAVFLSIIFISISSNIKSLAKDLKSNNLINGLDKNFIQVDGEDLQSYSEDSSSLFHIPFNFSKTAGYYKLIKPCFKIKFDTVNRKIKLDKLTNEYFSNYIGYDKYLDIKILDKHLKEKVHLELLGWDYFTSGKVSKLNNFKYEYGDIIKISGNVLERQSILGKIIGATKDYSKGLKDVEDIENLGFEITENGLKEIRNKAPIIKNIDDLTIIKNSKFNPLEGVVVTDDLDGNITKDLIIEGNVDIANLGEYFIKYKVKDSWNKKLEVTRKITVIENPKLNENIIKVNGEFSPFGEERFNIEFDDLKKTVKVKKCDAEIIGISSTNSTWKFGSKLNKNFKDKKYFSIEIFNKRKIRKLFIELNGEDYATSYKLDPLKYFTYEYGDIIKLWHGNPNILEILGDVINAKEDYINGMQEDIEAVQFEITPNGLKAIYNEAPVINGIEDIKIKIGEDFDPLKGVNVKDDHDINLIPKVEGSVDVNKLGNYELKYFVKDNWGKEIIAKRVVTVRSNNKPTIMLKNNDIIIEQDYKVDDKYLLNLINVTDEEDGNLIDKVIINSNINSEKPGIYEVKYSVQDNDGNISYLNKEVTVVRSISMSIPIKINFQVVTNALDKKFITANYKITNNKKSKVKVYLKSFIKEEGKIDIVNPNKFSNWTNISETDSMSKLALGLYIKDGFKNGVHYISNPIWLNNNMNNKTYLGEIGQEEISIGEFSFVAKHGEYFTGESTKGKYSLVLEFE